MAKTNKNKQKSKFVKYAVDCGWSTYYTDSREEAVNEVIKKESNGHVVRLYNFKSKCTEYLSPRPKANYKQGIQKTYVITRTTL